MSLCSRVGLAVALVHCAPGAPAFDQVTAGPTYDYRAMYAALTSLQPDPQRVATIDTRIVLQRPGFQLVMSQGQIALLAVGGCVIDATFVGSGSATLTPVLALEQRELMREFGSETFQAEIESAAIFFADGTLEELEADR